MPATHSALPGQKSAVLRTVPDAAFVIGIAVVFVAACVLAVSRTYDPDEFEHLQFAWLVHIGAVPYLDFFEHHTPLYHLLIAPIVGSFDITRGETAWQVLTTLRAIAIATGVVSTGLLYLAARRLHGTHTALLAVALLVANGFYLNKFIEIRPDQLGVLGLVACTYALIRAFPDDTQVAANRTAWLILAGFAATCAILATQKNLFCMPGFAVAYVAMSWRRIGAGAFISGLVAVLLGAAAAATPVLWYFHAHGALYAFFERNFLFNADYPRYYRGALVRWIKWGAEFDTLFWLLTVAGTLRALWWLARGRTPRSTWVVVAPLLTLAAGALVIPVAQRQYILLVLPFAAIAAAAEAVRLTGWLIGALGRRAPLGPLLVPAAIAGYAVLHIGMNAADNDRSSLATFSYVLSETPPDATIMVGFSPPTMALRRPAWTYFFIHSELRTVLRHQNWPGLREGLRDGTIRPLIIDYGDDLRELPPEFQAFVAAHYAPVGIGTLWRRVDTPG